MFRSFKSQDERREYGGSCFLEFSYCTKIKNASIKKIPDFHTIKNWKNDSLYLHGDDMNAFWRLYSSVFVNGIYANGKTGVVDMWGINYYSPDETTNIIQHLMLTKPNDYEILVEWLKKAEEYNGFYILGL